MQTNNGFGWCELEHQPICAFGHQKQEIMLDAISNRLRGWNFARLVELGRYVIVTRGWCRFPPLGPTSSCSNEYQVYCGVGKYSPRYLE